MNTITTMRYLTVGLALACYPALASEPLEVQWNEVCKVTNGSQLAIQTTNGAELRGYCVAVSVDELSVRTTDGKLVKLTRAALGKIHMHRGSSGQLKSLGKGMHNTLRDSFGLLFSPLAPIGIVGVPGTLAWGAIAAPFCALSDIHDKLHGTRELKVI